MFIIQSFFIAVSLAMDAFAVSITNGMAMKTVQKKKALAIGASFGIFQMLMPIVGYAVGGLFSMVIERYDHYIALVFLSFIGGKMMWDGIRELKNKDSMQDETEIQGKTLSVAGLILQSFATSIDALIIGISFIAMGMNWLDVIYAVLLIGAVTFSLSVTGVYMGKKFGELLGSKAEVAGGLILIAIGVKIFIQHTL